MADAQEVEPVAPIRFSAKQLAGKDLEPAEHLRAKVRGNPRQIISQPAEEPRMATFFAGDVLSFVYETGPAKFRSENTLFDEYIQVLEGAIHVTTEATGETQKFAVGDNFVIPKGFTGTLETLGELFRELVVVETQTFTNDDMAD